MLLPSSVSNPANMMAQALTMYKSMIGNVSSGHETSLGITAGVKGDSSSEERVDESTKTPKTANNSSQPEFSLQSHKNLD